MDAVAITCEGDTSRSEIDNPQQPTTSQSEPSQPLTSKGPNFPPPPSPNEQPPDITVRPTIEQLNVDQVTQMITSEMSKQQQQQTAQLQTHITGLLSKEQASSRAAWGNWMGVMAENIDQRLLPRFYRQSLELVLGLVEETQQMNTVVVPTTAHISPQVSGPSHGDRHPHPDPA